MKRVGLVLLLMILPGLNFQVRGQDTSSIASKILFSIERSEPSWKLEKRLSSRNGDYVSLRWKLRKSTMEVLIKTCPSADVAVDCLEALGVDLELAGLQMRKLNDHIDELGQNSYVWEDAIVHGKVGVAFSKGRFVVHVTSSSMNNARRFALLVESAMPAA